MVNENYKQSIKTSYADTVKNKGLPSGNKNLPIVKPKQKQSIINTKEDLNKVSPDELKIVNVESKKIGSIVIQSEN